MPSTRRSSGSRRRRKNPTPGRPLPAVARAILNRGRKPGKQAPTWASGGTPAA